MNQVTLATFNLLNLAAAGFKFYDNQDVYTQSEYRDKTRWTAAQLTQLRADVVACEEVFSEQALRDCVDASEWMRGATVLVPHTDTVGTDGHYLPRVGVISKLKILEWHSHEDIPPSARVTLPDHQTATLQHTRFSRPVLEVLVETSRDPAYSRPMRLFVLHLKSKRPDFNVGDNERLPQIVAMANHRSLLKRSAEAAGVRQLVVDRLWHTAEPVAVMGDFNDVLHSPTTQLIAATQWKAHDRAQRDAMLYDSWDICKHHDLSRHGPQRRDVSYTHVHEGIPEVIDHVLLSEEFAPFSEHCIAHVSRVDIYNDHLNNRLRGMPFAKRVESDHGQVVVTLNFL